MLGRHLKFLAAVADLARLDFEAAAITLKTVDDRLYARYRGAYSSGQRWLTAAELDGDLPNLNYAVPANQFKSMVSLYNDDLPVVLTPHEGQLRMEGSGTRRVGLALRPDVEELETNEGLGEPVIEARVDLLLRELEVASEFAARSMANPVMTGIKVSSEGGGVVNCEATDGYCLYKSNFIVPNTAKFNLVLQAYDTVLGLKLLAGGEVKAYERAGHMFFVGDNAMFRSPSLRGDWPNTAPICADANRQDPVIIPPDTMRALVQSVRVLGTSNDLVLRGDGETLFLQSTSSETGDFQETIPATIKGEFVYDVSYFLLAMNLGSQVRVSIPNQGERRTPTYMECDHRHLWVGQRIYENRNAMEPAQVVLQRD